MTTLFPIQPNKISTFMSSLDSLLSARTQLKANHYAFDFNIGIPVPEPSTTNTATEPSFKWNPIHRLHLQREFKNDPPIEPVVTTKKRDKKAHDPTIIRVLSQ